ncbi:transglutaminase domain-containing protein [Allorhizocola rhizosphaerae]|uniref:transglutaminase family protein n=1 Tax=Allorhizocola rhizosphaerae TaxID=1872709 RepID=UPI000E3D6C59|nr:transglutaminase domain-containing protein [Allorhizocola rhizosphaerae]
MTRVVWAALLVGVGAWQLSLTWSVDRELIIASAVLPVVLIGLGARLLPAPAVTFTVVGLGAVGFYVMCVRNGLDPGDVLRRGVPRLLAAPRPVPPEPGLLLPGATFGFVTGVWVGLRAVSSGLIAAPVGAVALYTGAALLGSGGTDPKGFVAAALVFLAAAGWVGRNPAVSLRRLAPATVAAVGVALLIGPIAMADAFDPRRLVEPEGRHLRQPSPLAKIAAWHRQGDVELLRYTSGRDERLRLVALTNYTGASWSAEGRYRRIGTVSDPRQRTADIAVSIGALEGPWLPGPARPLAVSLSDVEFDSDSGSLALRDGVLQPGLSYRVTSGLDGPTEEAVAAADVPSGAEMRSYVELPSAPATLTAYAQTITDGAKTAYEKAVSLEYSIRESGRHDPDAPSGSSYARLETFLFGTAGTVAGAKEGTAEQFASAFAVLARAVGLPTRIVVGFAPGTPGDGGTRVVHGRDAHAWPEVYFSGIGWYPFDPTPAASTPSETRLEIINRLFQQSIRPSAAPSSAPPMAAGGEQVERRVPSPATAAPGYPLLAVGIALLLLGSLILARRLRTVRHRRAGAAGAWAELLDVLLLIGRSPARGQPAPVIAAGLAATVPMMDAVLVVADEADRAAFGPGPVPGDVAWRAMRRVQHAARTAIPWHRRIFWYIDPRPLFRSQRAGRLPRTPVHFKGEMP